MDRTASFIKILDQSIGPILVKILPAKPVSKMAFPKTGSILIIRPGGLGDAFVLLPALKELHDTTGFKIDILCEPRNHGAFASVPFIREIFSYLNPVQLIKSLSRKYIAVIDTEQSHFLSAIVTRFANTKIATGFKTNNREKMYTYVHPYEQNKYEGEVFWNYLSAIFKYKNKFHIHSQPYISPEPIDHISITKKKKPVCLFTGASIRERLWPEKKWATVADWLNDNGFIPVLIGGKKETEQCRSIENQIEHDCLNLCGQLSISQTVSLFSKSQFLISTDSGILHLGVICNFPTISLFGPGIEQKWAPIGKRHRVINKHLPCSPCTLFGATPSCDHRSCMKQINIEDLIKEIKALISTIKSDQE